MPQLATYRIQPGSLNNCESFADFPDQEALLSALTAGEVEAVLIGREAMLTLLMIAKLQKEAHSARLDGRKEKARRGEHAAGFPALGYKTNQGLEVDPNGAAIVQDIFALHQQGYSLHAIASVLNQAGIPTKKGGKWYAGTVRYILNNPKYKGILRQSFKGETFQILAPNLKIF